MLAAYQTFAKVDFGTQPRGVQTLFRLPNAGDPGPLADSVAGLVSAPIERKQQILETGNVVTRLEMLLELMRADRPTA